MRWLLKNKSIIGEIKKNNKVRLNLGCGETYLEGWVNIDIPDAEGSHTKIKVDLAADITTLDYKSETVDEILLNAVFEHFQRHEALRNLRKFYLWLKENGKITVMVPDFWGTVKKLKKSKGEDEKSFWYRHLFGPQDTKLYGNHLDGFDEGRLREIFRIVGFTKLTTVSFGSMPFVRVEAIKTRPYLSDELYRSKVVDYLIYHEYRGEPSSAFFSWTESLGFNLKEMNFIPPMPHFRTQRENLIERMKRIARNILGERLYTSLKERLK
ncbi:MAG: hypothetical protein AUJ31_00270 [Parcubacteria group bacterium CG1_02_39_15]|nr:MAG: hypothetical protein AUJ31_00270 [Parcubacteria group bacterium CG1_02_39_15]